MGKGIAGIGVDGLKRRFARGQVVGMRRLNPFPIAIRRLSDDPLWTGLANHPRNVSSEFMDHGEFAIAISEKSDIRDADYGGSSSLFLMSNSRDLRAGDRGVESAGISIGDDAVRHLNAVTDETSDRPGRAKIDVVGMGSYDENAGDVAHTRAFRMLRERVGMRPSGGHRRNMLRRPRVDAEAIVMPAAPAPVTRSAQGSATGAKRVRRTIVALAAAALTVGLVPVLSGPPAQAVGTLPPVGVKLPVGPKSPVAARFTAAIDDYPEYEGQIICDPAIKRGSLLLRNLLASTYGTPDIGISRSCSIGGPSEHKEGRALDWMVSYRNLKTRAKANAFLSWLLATDQFGNKHAMARRLGVMYIGWNDHIWKSYQPSAGWQDLKRCSVNPKLASRANDTYCHRNHIHLSLSWDGAAGTSSFWDATPSLVRPCPETWSAPSASKPAVVSTSSAQDFVPISVTRVLDSRTGLGIDHGAPCRLGQDRWSGDGRHLVAHVLSAPGVPTTGLSAVAVRIHLLAANAPSYLSLWPTGTSRLATRILGVRQNGSASVTTVVPLGADGTISMATSAGDAWVAVDVVGWVQSTQAKSLTAATSGTLHATRSTTLYDSARNPGGDLAPGETRNITLGGVAGLPRSSIAGFNLSVTPYGGTGNVGLRVYRPGATLPMAPSASGYGVLPRTTQVITGSTDNGTIAVRNDSLSAVQVRIGISAWTGVTRAASGSSVVALRPGRLVYTPTGIGAGPLLSHRVWRLSVLGRAGVPATGVKTVFVQVSSLSSSGYGDLYIWPGGVSQASAPALSIRRRTPVGDVIAVPVGADGRVQMTVRASTSTPILTQLAVYVVGYSH